ncbi:hypothetical protein FACS189434_03830 [Bacteroidia bacterium]|nr:hypothetical protein FACS189434_03830 [Bacteroidia bacterium]
MKNLFLLLSGLICFSTVSAAKVQGAGGVPGAKVWMQTGRVSDTLSREQYKWTDVGGDSIVFRDARRLVEYKVGNESVQFYNFNPAINLSTARENLELFFNNTSLSQSTVFSVWAPNNEFDRDHFLYSLNGRPGDGVIMTQNYVFQSEESRKTLFDYGSETGKDMFFRQGKSIEPNINIFKERALQIQTYYRALQPGTSIWGEPHSSITLGGSYRSGNVNNNSSFILDSLRNIPFYGFTPEFIVYNRLLTPTERMKVETYLAIKYGLTLDNSYINSKGDMLWNIKSDSIYSHRITGYERDDSSGLYQTQATTSYEEEPYYSHIYGCYQTDIYYKPTPYRLLVFGKQKASPVEDYQYLLMGDNGDSIATSIEIIKGDTMKIMKRRWLVNTNTPPTADADKKLEWDIQGLTIYTEKFTGTVIKTASTSNADGSAVTTIPLKGRDGYFTWFTGLHSGLTIKFGSNNPNPLAGNNDYGYYFAENGEVYAIEQGVRSSDIITTIAAGQKIEIEKEDNFIFLRVNGHRIPYHHIVINEQDAQTPFYGSVLINGNADHDIVLNNFQHGGFVATGDWLELSYILKRADEFLNYSSIGKSYLIIDRSGTGEFNAADVDVIPSTNIDAQRSKIIFNNIFWNRKGNGKEIFTFGYKPSKISGEIVSENPTCEKEVQMQDGRIKMFRISGIKGFNYALKQSGKWLQSGVFYGDSLILDSLAAGTYVLTVSEIGGSNFSRQQPNEDLPAQVLSKSYALDTANVWIEWNTLGLNTRATVGFAATDATIANPNAPDIVNYGVHIVGNQLYLKIKGVANELLFASIDSSNYRIRLERKGSVISVVLYDKNGEIIQSEDITGIDDVAYYYGAVSLVTASSPVYNLKTNGFGDTPGWYKTDNMLMDTSNGDRVNYTVRLESPCTGEIAPPEPPSPSAFADFDGNHIAVYYENPNDMTRVTAFIALEKPSQGQLLVRDAVGRLISTIPLANNVKQQKVNITLPMQGIYFITVKTEDWVKSEKVF